MASETNNFSFESIKGKLIKQKDNEFKFNEQKCAKFLFESLAFNNLTLKNHFCYMCATDNFLCDNFGNPTTEYVNFYRNVAKSGVGTIFTGGAYVGTKKLSNIKKLPKKYATINDNKKNLEVYRKAIKQVHISGSKIFLTIKSIFGRGDIENKFLNIFNYSASFGKNFYDAKMPCVRLSDGKCGELVENYAKVAENAKSVGFDGIVIDGSLFNIIGEFSSAEFNRRNFGYFTETEDMPLKLLREVHNKVQNINIIYKFSLTSFINAVYGSNVKHIKTLSHIAKEQSEAQVLELLLKLIKAGVDGFIFDFGTFETAFLNDYSQFMCENLFTNILKSVKEFFTNAGITNKFGKEILIVSTDNFNNISSAFASVTDCATDLVDVTKQIYSDNGYLLKIKQNRPFIPCLKCSKCDFSFEKYDTLSCTVNPNICGDVPLKTTRTNKLVAVVGSGVAGINSAIWLAERGFEVELYEKFNSINKNGRLCEIYKFDELLSAYNDYLENKLKGMVKLGNIKLFLNQEFGSENVKLKQYASVIVATGFHERFLDISGAVLSNVKSIYDVLGSKRLLNSKNNIVILAKTELSLKLAIYLLLQNKKVSLVMPSIDFLLNLSKGKLTYYIKVLKDLHASVFVNARVKRIEDDFVELTINGKLKNLPFDTILLNLRSNVNYSNELCARNIDCDLFVYEPELYPNNKLYYDLAKSRFAGELYLIGNALTISGMENDIKNAYYVAKNL